MFLFTAVTSIQEYELSIFVITSVFVSMTNILVMNQNMPENLKVIETFEKIIEKSKLANTEMCLLCDILLNSF